MITSFNIKNISNRNERARKAPWKALVEGRDFFGGASIIKVTDFDSTEIEPIGLTAEEIDFIAIARNAVPELLGIIKGKDVALERNDLTISENIKHLLDVRDKIATYNLRGIKFDGATEGDFDIIVNLQSDILELLGILDRK